MSKIDLIKQRLQKLQSKGSDSFTKVDYSKIFWKPKMGSQVIRILPRKENRDYPFVEVSFHQYNVFKKSVYCLDTFGEQDPVNQYRKELYNEGSPEAIDLAKKLSPRYKYFAQVLVRGEEDMGARLWEFNKTTYEKLLSIMANEDFGDITDLTEGTDLTIEGYKDTIKIGKKEVEYIAVNVTPKRKLSAVSLNASEVQSYMDNQKDVLSIYKKFTYDEIKDMLKEYLQPKDDTPSVSQAKPAIVKAQQLSVEDDDDAPAITQTPDKKTSADKFGDLFGED
jgi:hypothetical protein